MRGAATGIGMLIFVAITIIVVLFLMGGILQRFPVFRKFVDEMTSNVRIITSSVAGQSCSGLPQACRRWVYDGLGLYFTYAESDVFGYSAPCGIKHTVCPMVAGSRIGIKDCLAMCVDILSCEAYFEDYGYEDITECYNDVYDKVS